MMGAGGSGLLSCRPQAPVAWSRAAGAATQLPRRGRNAEGEDQWQDR